MAYRFKLDESLTRGVRRIGLSQLELAETRLKSASDPAVAVHEVRKSLKRLRALLRLVRPGLDDKVYRRENEQLRDAGRMLSAARDMDVLRQTLAKLETGLAGNDRASIPRLRAMLDGNGADRPNGSTAADMRRARAALAAAKKRFARLKVEPEGFAPLEEGLRKSYRAGKRALARAAAQADEEAFHDVRKAVQQHWRQMLLLSRAWPEMCKARATAAREVAQLLGEEHDYAILAEFIAARRGESIPEHDVEMLERACRDHQRELRLQAMPRVQRLFADGAGRFARQVASCWAAAQELDRLDEVARKAADGRADAPAPAIAEKRSPAL
jgi:CHAD domain-containing protein